MNHMFHVWNLKNVLEIRHLRGVLEKLNATENYVGGNAGTYFVAINHKNCSNIIR